MDSVGTELMTAEECCNSVGEAWGSTDCTPCSELGNDIDLTTLALKGNFIFERQEPFVIIAFKLPLHKAFFELPFLFRYFFCNIDSLHRNNYYARHFFDKEQELVEWQYAWLNYDFELLFSATT